MKKSPYLKLWTVGNFVSLIGMLIAFVGFLIFFSQALTWLKLGVWPPISAGDVFPIIHPHQDLIGLQTVIDSTVNIFYRLPASLVFYGFGLILSLYGSRLENERQERLRNSN